MNIITNTNTNTNTKEEGQKGRGETARITWLREIGVDTGATDCQIFTHFKQNKFIQNKSPMDDFIYLLPFIYFCNQMALLYKSRLGSGQIF